MIATPELDTRIKALTERTLPELFTELEPGLSAQDAAQLDVMLRERAARWGQAELVEPAARAAILIAELEAEALAARLRALSDRMDPTSSTMQRVVALTLLVLGSTLDAQVAAADHDSVSLTRALCAWFMLRLKLPLRELTLELAEALWHTAELTPAHWKARVVRLAKEYEDTHYAGQTPT